MGYKDDEKFKTWFLNKKCINLFVYKNRIMIIGINIKGENKNCSLMVVINHTQNNFIPFTNYKSILQPL